MNLNFHHHTTFIKKRGDFYVVSLHGVFIEELANQFESITLFLFENSDPNSVYEDYLITNPKIRIISLGKKKNLLIRILFSWHYISIMNKYKANHFIIRSPTPLVNKIAKNYKYNVILMIVGDYLENISQLKGNYFKVQLIKLYYRIFQYEYLKTMSNVKLCLMNNPYFIKKFQLVYQKALLVSTTIVKQQFLSNKTNYEALSSKETINILYVGRIDESKGIINLVQSLRELGDKTMKKINFKIVGWEIDNSNILQNKIYKIASDLGVNDSIYFMGKSKHGEEIYEHYKSADIFYIGSKATEGFPRVIWEAMASKLSVVCSKVGGIPFYLTSEHVYFLNSLEINQIVNSLSSCIMNDEERNSKINKAFELVEEFTIEKSVRKIAKYIHESN